MRSFPSGQGIGWQRRRGKKINDETCGHSDAGGGKTVVPAEFLAERATHQRRQERAEIDADIENREGAVAAAVAGRVKRTDLGRDIGLERAVAENENAEREQKQMLECHHEMADRHQRCAKDDGAALAEHAVGQQAAEDRREIDEASVEAVDLRGELLRFKRAEHEFQSAFECAEARHTRCVLWREQIFDHIEHQQRAHPIIREALPHLGGEQEGEPARMAEQISLPASFVSGCGGRGVHSAQF